MARAHRRPRVVVIGAGPAGLAAAIAISRRLDAQIVVRERASELKPVGAGVLVQPSGLAVLDALGLGDAVRAAGSRIDRLQGTTASGRTVIDLRYARLDHAAHGVGIVRRRLHRILVDAFHETGARLELGCDVENVDEDADLVVLADGARSKLRERAGIAARVRPYDWSAVWTTVPTAPGGRVLQQRFRSGREMLGLLPSGEATRDEPALLTLFWSLPPAGYGAWRASPLDDWKARVAALAPECAAELASIGDLGELAHARYYDVQVDVPWSGRAVAIGDCAHATSPQLGQGVNLALLDAHALALAIARHGTGTAALAAYAARRRAHTRFYQWASRMLTPLFQSHGRILPALRDALAQYAFALPYLGRQALHTLAGTKTGILAVARNADALLENLHPDP